VLRESQTIQGATRKYSEAPPKLRANGQFRLKYGKEIDLTQYQSDDMFVVCQNVVIVRALVVVHGKSAAELGDVGVSKTMPSLETSET
jgi:hypothetical protein